MKIIYLLLLSLIILSCSSAHYCYIVRHAEKLDNTPFSLLSPAGHQRAAILRDSMLNKKIDLIFATFLIRTQETASPLAQSLHKPLLIYRHDAIDSIVSVIKGLKNKNVLLVGHSGTIPRIVQGITGQKGKSGDELEYDNLYTIKIKNGKSELRVTKY